MAETSERISVVIDVEKVVKEKYRWIVNACQIV